MAAEGSPAGALARWGDASFALALLILDDRRAAERLATAILARELPGDPLTLDSRIARALLLQARRRGPRLRQRLPLPRRVLPVALRRVDPVDRVLLALWLLQRLDPSVLAPALAAPTPPLAECLAAALLRLSPYAKATLDEPVLRSVLDGWLRPGASAGAWPAPGEITARRMVDAARDTLREAVGSARLPVGARAAVADALDGSSAATAGWLRRSTVLSGLAIAVCGLVLVLIAMPGRDQPSRRVQLQPTPHEVVAAALAAWHTPPATGALHRQVWARSSLAANAEALVTDIWLEAGSARHRVEVRRGDQVVEWQLGDGQARLLYAAQPDASSCRWAERQMLDSVARLFSLDAAAQQEVRDARLALGGYGLGVEVLRAAAEADDLRSFGTRAAGARRLVGIGFTEYQGAAPRRLLLWIDAATAQLHLIQELPSTGQGRGRELWRLQTSDAAPVPLGALAWDAATRRSAPPIDPACPGLDAEHVVSLRALDPAAIVWGQLYLPAPAPPTLTAGALLRQSPADGFRAAPGDYSAIFLGPQRRLRLQTVWVSSARLMEGERVGDWIVAFRRSTDTVAGEACRPDPVRHTCASIVDFTTTGFTRDELRELLPKLKLVTPESWLAYDGLFLEPTPLSAEVKAILAQASAAQQPRPGQTLEATVAWRVRAAPASGPPRNPYEPDPAAYQPERLTQSLLLAYGPGGVERFRELLTLPDGRLYQGHASDGRTDTSYWLPAGVAQSMSADMLPAAPPALPLQLALRPFLAAAEPITVARQDGAVLLTQWGPSGVDTSSLPVAGPIQPWLVELVAGRLQRRLWLDAATWQLRRAETVQVDELGGETLLSAVEVTSFRIADAAAPPDALLPLPPETIRVKRTPSSTFIDSPGVNVDAIQHALVWDAVPGITQLFDVRPTRLGTDPTLSTDPRLEPAVYATLPEIARLGLTKSTIYRLAGGRAVEVQQGPRGLLRHGLRNAYQQRQASSIEPVAPLPLMIAGESHDGWLVALASVPALVVEVDDVLLFVSGLPADQLREALPPLLAQLTWGDP